MDDQGRIEDVVDEEEEEQGETQERDQRIPLPRGEGAGEGREGEETCDENRALERLGGLGHEEGDRRPDNNEPAHRRGESVD